MQYIDDIFNELYSQALDIIAKLMNNFSPGATNLANIGLNDAYAILGLDSSASDEDIDNRYRYLMKCLHPDVCPGMHLLPVLINTAYNKVKKLRTSHSP